MAKTLFSVAVIEELLFGYVDRPVKIKSLQQLDENYVEIDVEGPDVPECEKAQVLINMTTNRLGQRLLTMKLQPEEASPTPTPLTVE